MATAPITYSDAPAGFTADPPPAGAPAAPGAAAPAGPVFSDAPPGFVADPPPSTAADVGKGLVSGVGMVTQTPSALVNVGDWIARKAIESNIPFIGKGVTEEELNKRIAEAKATGEFRDLPRAIADPISQAAGGAYNAAAANIPGVGPNAIGYQPTTGAGEAAQLVGGFIPGAISGEATLPALAGRLVTKAAVPGVGAYVGGNISEDLGYGKLPGQILGGGLAASAPGAIKAGVQGAFSPIIGNPAKMAPELQSAIENAESAYPGATRPYLPIGAATDQPFVRRFTSPLAGEVPIAGGLQAGAAQKSLDSIGDYATGLNKAAGASNPTSAGETLINKMAGWFTGDSKTQVQDAYNTVGADPAIRQQPSNVASTLQTLQAQRANANMSTTTGLEDAISAANNPNGLDYAGTKLQRTNFRLNTPAGLLPGEYQKLYDAWTQDLNSVAAANGPAVAAAHQVANDLALSVGNRRKAIGSMLGMKDEPGAQPTVSPDQMFGRVQAYAQDGSKENIAKLQQIKDTVGKGPEWQEFAGTVGQQLGLNANGDFDLPTFARNYSGLSDPGKDALFGAQGSPGFRGAYDVLGGYATRGKVLQKMAGPSWQHPIVGAAEAIGGMFLEPMATLGSLGGGTVLMGLLARPATAASVARWAKAGQSLSLAQRAGKMTPQMLRSFNIATRNLHNTAAAAGIQLPANLGAQGGRQ